MQAIILAAGMGRRLAELTSGNTKCMVSVNGTPMIDRLLGQLSHCHLNRVVIVVGYEGKKLMDFVGDRFPALKIEYVFNPVYDKTNNIYSLFLAKDKLLEDDTLLLESDLVLDDSLFSLLLDNPYPNLALVAKYETWMDGTMVRIDGDDNIINFIPKEDFHYDQVDEYYKTLNVYKFSKEFSANKYVPFLEAYSKVVGNNEYYENVLRIISFLKDHDLKALPIHGEKWYEIDDKQDLDIAEAIFAEDEDLLGKYYGRDGGFWRFPDMLDFCYLVNPYFPSENVFDEMQANFKMLLTTNPSGMKVNSLLASKCWSVKEKYVVPGNGAAELIKALMDNLQGRIGIVRPTFEEYPNRYDASKLVTFVPSDRDYRYTAKDLIDFFDTKRIGNLLLINPDNPSGNFIPSAEIRHLAAWCEQKGVRFILDESFVDFSEGYPDNTMLRNDLLETYPHMAVMKSISKSYGVPGLRLGILASADVRLISAMKKSVPSWNINSFAEFFMQISSKYEADFVSALARFRQERKIFEDGLRSIPLLRVMPTQANFFLCEILSPWNVNDLLLWILKRYNILIQDCSHKIGLTGKQYIRIAIRNHEDNQRLLEAFRHLCAKENQSK